jgi:hypothetical protein
VLGLSERHAQMGALFALSFASGEDIGWQYAPDRSWSRVTLAPTKPVAPVTSTSMAMRLHGQAYARSVGVARGRLDSGSATGAAFAQATVRSALVDVIARP